MVNFADYNSYEAMERKLSFIIIIPARYGSSRFPGKPLTKIGGKEMILRVVERAEQVCDDVVVATDDERIFQCVEDAGMSAVMTSSSHRSGTDRIMEAYHNINSEADVIINIQGDEPFVDPVQIEKLMQCFIDDPETQIATLARKFDPADGFDALFDPNHVKLTFSDEGDALYFSRSIIPYVRGTEWKEWLDKAEFHTHIGVYAYKASVLQKITKLPPSSLEKAESLEQLRWLQAGYRIKVALTESKTVGIDTPADIERAEEYMRLNRLK